MSNPNGLLDVICSIVRGTSVVLVEVRRSTIGSNLRRHHQKSYVLPLGRTSVVIIKVLCCTIGSNLRRHYQSPMFYNWVEPPSSLSNSYVLPLGRTSVVIIKVLCSTIGSNLRRHYQSPMFLHMSSLQYEVLSLFRKYIVLI